MSGFLQTLIVKHQGASTSSGSGIKSDSASTFAGARAIYFVGPRPHSRYETYSQDRYSNSGDSDIADESQAATAHPAYNPVEFGLSASVQNPTLLSVNSVDRKQQPPAENSSESIDASNSKRLVADQMGLELARRLGNAAAGGENRGPNSAYGVQHLQGSNTEPSGAVPLATERSSGWLNPAVQNIAGQAGQLKLTQWNTDRNADLGRRRPNTGDSLEGHAAAAPVERDRLLPDSQFERTGNYPAGAQETATYIKQIQAVLSAQAAIFEQAEHRTSDSVVNVTIGRVEVRATPATHRHGTTQHTGPTALMTLGDYLNRRNGGGG